MNGRRLSVDPRPSAPARARRADLIAVVVIAAACCIAICGYWFGYVVSAPGPQPPEEHGKLISSMYDPPTNAIENALVKGDGQLFAGQATDPLVRRPEMVRGGPSEQAYRYQRPVYGWLGWAASGGRPAAVAWALVAVTVAAVTALIWVAARWLVARGSDPRWALLLLVSPGVFVDLTWVGPEALGVALVVVGLHRWMSVGTSHAGAELGLVPSRGRALAVEVPAVAALAAAGLCRETLLLVPFVLVVAALLARRWRPAVTMACAAVPYLAWVGFLQARIGSLPRGSVGGRLSLLPFGGLLDAAGSWGPADLVFAAMILGGAVLALAVGRRSGLRPLVAAHLALAAALGEPVWHRFPDFGRVLLPLAVLSLLAAVPGLASRRTAPSAPSTTTSEAAGGAVAAVAPVPSASIAGS